MQNSIPLNSLNTFYYAAKNQSFLKAAESLFVTPSAVSHQIRNLEGILGYKLFERLDKAIRLTPQGERLYADILMPMKQLHEASRKALRMRSANTLALSVAPAFATGWLIPRLADFYSCFPEINLTVVATTEFADFHTGTFDAAIRIGKREQDEEIYMPLFDVEIVAVCHPTLINTNKGTFTPMELTNRALIQNSSIPEIWHDWFKSAKTDLPPKKNIVLQVQNFAQVTDALQSGNNIGLVDKNFIKKDIQSGRLAIACDHVLQSDNQYFLTAPKSVENLPSFQNFKDWLSRHMNSSE